MKSQGHKTGCKQAQTEMETELDSLGDREIGQVPGNSWVSEDTTETLSDKVDPSTSLGVSLVSRMRSSFRRRSNVTMGQVDKSEILMKERSSSRMTMV